MPKRFSISHVGNEIYIYGSLDFVETFEDPEIISGFMEAMQIYSEMIGSEVRQIHFANLNLYTRTYGEITLRLLSKEFVDMNLLDKVFSQLSKVVLQIMSDLTIGEVIPKDIGKNRIFPLLKLLLDHEVDFNTNRFTESNITKIGIAGLSNVGKTSIKNLFFNKWSEDKLKQIKPTLGVETTNNVLEYLGKKIATIDFGGQTSLRRRYLDQKYLWNGLTALIYVIDIQKMEQIDEAVTYLEQIWNLLRENSKKTPHLFLFLHKYDPKMRKELNSQVGKALAMLHKMLDFAVLNLTSIKDETSNIAMMKSLYFSMPKLIIKKIFEEKFMHFYYYNYIPQLKDLLANKSVLNITDEEFASRIRHNSYIQGLTLGFSLQKEWYKYMLGEWTPAEQQISHPSLKIEQDNQTLSIIIPYLKDVDLPIEIIMQTLQQIIKGIAKAFDLAEPVRADDKNVFAKWIFYL